MPTFEVDVKGSTFEVEAPDLESAAKHAKTFAESQEDKTTVGGQLARGAFDPLEGSAQAVSHWVPKPVEQSINAANNWLAEKTGLVAKLPEGGMDEAVRQREAQIQTERGANAKNIDWSRGLGNLLSPMNFIAPAVIGPRAGLAANLVRGAATGAAAGAQQPATGESFVQEKATQIGLGAAIGTGMSGAGAALGKGIDAFGSYLSRNYPENITSQAVQKILKRFSQDEKAGGPSAKDAIDLVNESRKPLMLADVSGRNVKGLAGNVARAPGESAAFAEKAMTERDIGKSVYGPRTPAQMSAAERLSQDINEHVFGGETMHQATEGLLISRSAASRPAYDAAHELQNVWSPRLQEFINDPAMKAGLARGWEIERLQSLAEGRPISTTQMGIDLDVEGNIKLVAAPNMRLLDMGKQGLDAMIADERNELTGRLSARGVALNQMRQAYIKTVDDLDTTGTYKKARETWAGYSQSLDSVKAGRASLNASVSPEENAAFVDGLSEANKEFYRLGVADMLRERLAKAGFSSDDAKSLIRSPWMRDQLRPAFRSPEAFDSFVDSVTAESQMFGTKARTLGGSQTAERRAEDLSPDHFEKGASILSKLANGHPFRAVAEMYHTYRDLGLKPNPEVNAAIARILFTANIPKTTEELQRMLRGRAAEQTNPLRKGAQAAQQYGTASAPSAAVIGTSEQSPLSMVGEPQGTRH